MTDPVDLRQGVLRLRVPATEGVWRLDLEPGDVLYLTGQTEEGEDLRDHRDGLVTEVLKADAQVPGTQDAFPVIRRQEVETAPEGDRS